jgi:hypothetical protein
MQCSYCCSLIFTNFQALKKPPISKENNAWREMKNALKLITEQYRSASIDETQHAGEHSHADRESSNN